MTGADTPLIEVIGIRKNYAGLRPLRIDNLIVRRGDQLALTGFDKDAAEAFVHLVTGAALPDEGDVRIAGKDTRAIATDTEWLASLDRFGIVTDRAVLVDRLSIASNLALPLTLTIDPMTAETRQQVERLAADADLPVKRLDDPASTLSAEERVRVHFARALAMNPALLILEHPTGKLEDPAHSRAFGSTLRTVAARRGMGWIALTADDEFVRASAGTRLTLNAATGRLEGEGGFWRKLFGRPI
ncbi:MAG TPA: ATP-binding cassette domain-containing protein [Vicinamibacterales bacterium]|nr:ATP-binding cassette domain-containing protein [Vicinamibacterales bacterium]